MLNLNRSQSKMTAVPGTYSDSPCRQGYASIAAIPREERIGAWQALFQDAFAVATAEAEEFQARVWSVAVDAMLVHEIRAGGRRATRTAAMIRRDALDHFLLYLSSRPMHACIEDVDIALPAGAILICDMARPCELIMPALAGLIIVRLSRDLVASVISAVDTLHGSALSAGAGSLLRAYLVALVQNAEHVTEKAAAPTARSTAELLAASILSTCASAQRADEPPAAVLLRAKRFIDDNIATASLSAEHVADAIGVSRATLYRMFEPLGGVATYVQDRRLVGVRRSLGRRNGSETIAAIGYSYGFSSDAHLSRAFRRKFGVAPSDIRRLSAGETALVVGDAGDLIADWLIEHG